LENIIKEILWQALVSQQLHHITALAASAQHRLSTLLCCLSWLEQVPK